MDQRASNADDSGSDVPARESGSSPPRLSRRDFATRFGAGGAAALGIAWASPHISTVRFAAKAAVGSPPPTHGSTTTTSTTIAGQEGSVSVSTQSPCVGDILTVHASGFAPRTAVTLELDSAERSLGVTTAGTRGGIDVTVRLPSGVTGSHELVVVGVRPGGRTLTLTVPLTIKTEDECNVGPENSSTTTTTQPGVTTTTKPGSKPTTSTAPPTTAPTSTTIASKNNHEGGGGVHSASSGGGFLAFTGTDSVDLALLGAAAAVGGRALFGLVAHRDEDDEEVD